MIRKLRINEDLGSSDVYTYPAIGILNGTVDYVFYERNPDYDYDRAHDLPFDDRPTAFRKATETYRLDRNKAYNNISEILEDLHAINPNIPFNLNEYDSTMPNRLSHKAHMYRSSMFIDEKTHNCIVSWYNFKEYNEERVYIPIYFLPRYVTKDEFYKFNINE